MSLRVIDKFRPFYKTNIPVAGFVRVAKGLEPKRITLSRLTSSYTNCTYSLSVLITACPGNCDICTSGTACTVCSSGFENTGTTCSAIASSLVQNCVTDNGSGVCTECASTYFLDPFSDLCVCE